MGLGTVIGKQWLYFSDAQAYPVTAIRVILSEITFPSSTIGVPL
jgi:hypothetical protein